MRSDRLVNSIRGIGVVFYLTLIQIVTIGCSHTPVSTNAKTDPTLANQKVTSARTLISQSKTEAALQTLEEAKKADPACLMAYVLRAQVYESIGRIKDARDEALVAHRLSPKDSGITLALLHYDVNFIRPVETEALAREAVAQNPEKADPLLWLGRIILQTEDHKRFPEALDAFEQARRIEPVNPETCVEKGRTYGRMGRDEDAIEWLKQALVLLDEAASHPGMPFQVVKTWIEQRRAAESLMEISYGRLKRTAELTHCRQEAARWSRAASEIRKLEARAAISPPDQSAVQRLAEIGQTGPSFWQHK